MKYHDILVLENGQYYLSQCICGFCGVLENEMLYSIKYSRHVCYYFGGIAEWTLLFIKYICVAFGRTESY